MEKTLNAPASAEPRPQQAEGIEGCFDGFEDGCLTGWAVFAGEPVSITVIIDGHELGEARSDLPRVDLASAGYHDCGFRIEVPPQFLDGQAHQVMFQLTDIGLTILGDVHTVTFNAHPTRTEPSHRTDTLENVRDDLGAVKSAFDPVFYRKSYPDIVAAGLDPWQHYTSSGYKELRNPSPDLSARAYLAQFPHLIASGEMPLAHWVKNGKPALPNAERRTPFLSSFLVHQDNDLTYSLIDPLYVYTKNEGVPRMQEAEYLQHTTQKQVDFNPLFDCAYYAKWSGLDGSSDELRKHYLTTGWKAGLSPHPLFDLKYYESQLDAPLLEPALVHYLREGWQAGLSPNALFDPVYYSTRERLPESVCPLIHYMLAASGDPEPHYLFNDNRFMAIASTHLRGTNTNVSPLELFLTRRNLQKLSTHLYFEPQHYLHEIAKFTDGPVKAQLQRAAHKMSPLAHYLLHGAKRHISPSSHFWPEFYRAQFLASDEYTTEDDLPDCFLRHYLRDGGKAKFSPSPLISLPFLAKTRKDFNPRSDEALAFVLRQPERQRPSPTPLFDPVIYRKIHSDVRTHDVCATEHFLTHGMQEQRCPRNFFSNFYARKFWGIAPDRNAMENYFLSQALQPKTRFLFTSHDASRTGAPGIVLRLIKDLSRLPGVECFCILDKGGELLPEFEAVAHTHVLSQSVYQLGPDNEAHRQEVSNLLKGIAIDYAICNSLETRHIAQYTDELGIRTIMLMHEVPDLYPVADLEFAMDKISHVVFPSNYIKDKMLGMTELDSGFYSVIGQGLLNDDFGHWPREVARDQVLKEFSLPSDAFIVAGCGTIDFRKGIDHYIATASKVLAQVKQDKPVYFLWFGYGDRRPGTPAGFVIDQLKQQGLQDRVRFVGARPDMPRYMAACDVFLMSSRADPFPCVIHEAMASALPVVYFNEGGGAGELVQEDGAGVTIGDTEAAADAILTYIRDPEARRQSGQRARSRILKEWRSTDYAANLVNLLTDTFGASSQLTNIQDALSQQAHSHDPAKQADAAPARTPVYFLSPDWSTSGVNTYTRNLIKGLRDLGWDAQLLFTRGTHTRFDTDADGQIVFPDVPYGFVFPERNDPESICQALKAYLVDAPPCIVVPNYDYIASSISPVVSPKTHWVGIAHSDHIEHYEHAYRLGHYWDAIVSVSSQVQDGILELNASLADKTHRIFCGVEPYEGSPIQRDPARIRLVYAGRIVTEQKQINRYIELAEELEHLGVPYELNMIGDGDQLPVLRRAAARIPGLVVHGRCSAAKTIEIMSQSDIFVLMSDYEGLPMSLVEAFSVGLVPIVYPIKSGIGEVLTSGFNGLITEQPSVKQLAEAVRDLHLDRQKLETLSGESRNTIDRVGLSLTHMSQSYSNLFEQVLKPSADGGRRRIPNFAWRSHSGALPPVNPGSFL